MRFYSVFAQLAMGGSDEINIFAMRQEDSSIRKKLLSHFEGEGLKVLQKSPYKKGELPLKMKIKL